MNNYTMKKDRVGIDESFPYPIKLEYDDENIYLTVLRIPEYYELKANKFAMKGKKKLGPNYKDEQYIEGMVGLGYLNHLYLTVETLQTSKKHCEFSRLKGNVLRKFKKSFTGYNNLQINQTYTFPIHNCLTSHQSRIYEKGFPGYLIVRGCFRYGGGTKYYSGRTGVNSNTAKIYFNT